MIFCNMCGAQNKDTSKYCKMCGAKIPPRIIVDEASLEKPEESGEWVCWKCGTVMKDGIDFCMTCGMIRQKD